MKKKVKLSKNNQSILQALNKGYVIDKLGNVSYRGRVLKPCYNNMGYIIFSVRVFIDGKKYSANASYHKMQAYQKYGNITFNEGVCVRHKDGNCKNNSYENIILGTQSDNMMDKSAEVRMGMAIYASSFVKKHNHEEIVKMHKEGLSYGKIMEKTGIKSKGTISFIVKESMASKV